MTVAKTLKIEEWGGKGRVVGGPTFKNPLIKMDDGSQQDGSQQDGSS